MGKKEPEMPEFIAGYQRKPVCCPVCYGKGTVHPGFYDHHREAWAWGGTAIPTPENCRSCGGSGIVWG